MRQRMHPVRHLVSRRVCLGTSGMAGGELKMRRNNRTKEESLRTGHVGSINYGELHLQSQHSFTLFHWKSLSVTIYIEAGKWKLSSLFIPPLIHNPRIS
jgi:hypothetical protein